MNPTQSFTWESPASDPNDETFGDAVDPVADPDALDDYDAVLVGEPFDAAVIGRNGAAAGPPAIREALAGVKTHHFAAGPVAGTAPADADAPRIGDFGDVSAPVSDLDSIREAVEEVAEAVHDSRALPVFLGGDNSLTVPNVTPLLDRGSVGVVNLDAHLDVREVRDSPTSGTPYRELLDAGLDAYVPVGVRHFETSSAYAAFLDERGSEVVTAEAVGDDLDRVVRRVREAVTGVDHLYLSVDCDVLDAAHAPGVSAPTPGGLTPRELFRIVRRMANHHRLAGVEVVECAPPLERAGPAARSPTAETAARVVAHALAGPADDAAVDGDGPGGERA